MNTGSTFVKSMKRRCLNVKKENFESNFIMAILFGILKIHLRRMMQTIVMSVFLLFFLSTVGHCLRSEELIRLKKAGLHDDTIQLLIQEKSIETGAFTVEEILSLKQAGFSETTLRMLIAENSFLKDRQPVVYGENLHTVRFTTINDVIRLKEAGLSDEVIQAILLVVQDGYSGDRQRAWDMLNSMGIWVDKRGFRPRPDPLD